MIEFNSSENIQAWCAQMRGKGRTIGFVPTMGALHDGHMSLVRIARAACDITISSIFVNPTQFNEKSDYDKYPVTLEDDCHMLEAEGCDAVFIPAVYEIYPESDTYDLEVNLGEIGHLLEAEKRPGHFDGVMQVVKRLLEIVTPDILYLGRKDYQQYLVIKRMVETYRLPVSVKECPIVREVDGLAMSSRNTRLSVEERRAAVKLSQTLFAIGERWKEAMPYHLTINYTRELNADPFIQVEYLEIVDSDTLGTISDWKSADSAIVCIAAWVGSVRLIDNATIY